MHKCIIIDNILDARQKQKNVKSQGLSQTR